MIDTINNKQFIRQFHAALEKTQGNDLNDLFNNYMADDYRFKGVHPFNELDNINGVIEQVWQPLFHSFKALQRREDIFIAGQSEADGGEWVMSMGHFMGLFDRDWLGIAPSHKLVTIRYAEFNCVKDGKIIQTGFFVDIIGVMLQVGLNPLPLSTGQYFTYPGPRTHDGVRLGAGSEEQSTRTMNLVNQMIDNLTALNQSGVNSCPPEVLAKTWDKNMVWYGPAGIGATYTIERYQQQHMYPFREGLTGKVFNGHTCRFAEDEYACFFGWPNLTNTAIGGFLGLPGANTPADMRVVDVYHREGDKLVENWVIIDLPYWLKQQGLDILQRTQSIANPYM
ncbi:SnoaL-like domain-containing protein [Pseudoalteromonas sp. NEC-BIFX-2020_002]|uniref:nuclear transport factor 2 family protein n=1 Tax=Pseudoalteromonas sp. NEC-BIFX-2020_002 TaxID=2732353 RepID=UPI001476BFE7|nr:nuclear transport factor 2 family protein [Pseudoalteromonas sp. NEC-BIFX-2020_002]NNG43129.1 SnoaL-like domain-containing protein [Pseudoalteromonas sp. NEC-BIFX-2020_002]